MFEITSNLDAALAKVEAIALRQLPFAASQALNDTIKDVKASVIREMERAFDRPTPFTLNAFEVKSARKDNLEAVLQPKAQAGRRDYLSVEARGGARPATGMEGHLNRSLAYSGFLAAIVPASGAILDQYGNWSSGQRNAVLSALGAQRDKTSNSHAQSRGFKRAERARAKYAKLMGLPVPKDAGKRQAWEDQVLKADVGGRRYFVPVTGLAPGVWSRDSGGQLNRILAFTEASPVYDARFQFRPTAEAVAADVFGGHLAKRVAEAIRSAR